MSPLQRAGVSWTECIPSGRGRHCVPACPPACCRLGTPSDFMRDPRVPCGHPPSDPGTLPCVLQGRRHPLTPPWPRLYPRPPCCLTSHPTAFSVSLPRRLLRWGQSHARFAPSGPHRLGVLNTHPRGDLLLRPDLAVLTAIGRGVDTGSPAKGQGPSSGSGVSISILRVSSEHLASAAAWSGRRLPWCRHARRVHGKRRCPAPRGGRNTEEYLGPVTRGAVRRALEEAL